MSKFIELCIAGKCLLDDIDDYVDAWHENPGEIDLSDYLGMDEKEYTLWMVDPDILPFIVEARRKGKNVSQVVEEFYALPMAARSESPEKARELMEWLKKNGHWN